MPPRWVNADVLAFLRFVVSFDLKPPNVPRLQFEWYVREFVGPAEVDHSDVVDLRDRIELLAPIEDPSLRARLIDTLALALQDNCLAWELDSEGRYVRRSSGESEPEQNYPETLMARARQH